MTNALVSIQFDDEYKEYITDATYAMIAVESGTETNWADLSTSAYFKAGSSITQLKLYKDGTESTYADILAEAKKNSNFPETFAAGDHLILTLSIAKANGNAAIKVSKVEVQKVPISETIPLEWLPKPKVEADGFTNNALTFVETETPTAKLNLDLASALQDIKFKFDFGDEQFSFEDREYLLSTDKARIEEALGITLPAIGATNASIDFSGLVAKLQSKVDGATTNKIMIVPKANDRWSSEKTDVDSVYTFTCNKPEFSIAVQEGNVWTKTFTIDEPTVTAGDAETIKSKLKYQYKTENGEWQDCEQLVQFDSAPDEKNYQVRAIYRDAIASEEVTVMLETPMQLPNSDMEGWTETTRETKYLGMISKKQPFFQPWDNKESYWWDTNNIATMPTSFTGGEGASLACFPTVTFILNGNKGKAAVIRTIGHGTINTGAIVSSKTRGILYAGTTSNDGTMNEGRDWNSRPTHLSFAYNYESRNNERFGAYIELFSGDTKIGSGKYESVKGESIQNFTTTTPIEINYSSEELKATSIRIRFCSVADGDNPDVDTKISVNVPEGSEDYYTIHGGSVLRIDDIQLIYNK